MESFIVSGFADEIGPEFEKQIQGLKDLDIHYMEIRGVNGRNIIDHDLDEVRTIKKQLDAEGIRVSAIGSPIGKIHITDAFEPHFERFKKTVEIAKILETSYIRLFSFFMEAKSAQENRQEVMTRLKQMVDYVADKDVILLHENEKGIYGDTAERCLDIVQTMNSDKLRLIFDPANFIQCGVETYPHAFQLLQDHVVYMHIKDALFESGKVVPVGYGHGCVRQILQGLKEKGYKGFLSLEPHLGEFVGFSSLEQEVDGPTFEESSDFGKFKVAADALRKILNTLDKVHIGVIGIGNMGSAHARSLYDGMVKGAKLAAVCDINPKRLDWAKEVFGQDIRYFSDEEDLLQSGTCDAILVATPHYHHPVMGKKVLEAGLHVLVEKPIGVYTQAVEALNAYASSSDRVFCVMYNQRTNPVYRKVKEMIDSGELGDIIRVNWVITDWFRTERYYQSGGWRATWEGEGGGVLLNQCPHQIDLIQWLCGLPKRVRGFADYGKFHDIEVEDDVTAFFEYENGATGVFMTSTGEAPGTNRLEISADNGKLVVEKGNLTFYRNRESLSRVTKESNEGFKKPENWTCQIPIEGTETGHVGIMQNFVNAILYGEDLIAPGISGIRGLELSNAIHLSSWTDDWVTLPIDAEGFKQQLDHKIKTSTHQKVVQEVTFDVEGSH